MSDIGLQTLKYASSLVAVAITFAGGWFYEFTVTDTKTGKRSLTPWGRYAIGFAVLALVLAGITTVWSDKLSADNAANAAAQLEAQKAQNESDRAQAEIHQEEVEKLLVELNSSVGKLSPEARTEVTKNLPKDSLESFGQKYPDLLSKLQNASDFNAFVSAIGEGIGRDIDTRVSKAADCSDINLDTLDNNPYRAGHFFFENSESSISYMVEPDFISVDVSDYSNSADMTRGYKFVFLDGSESATLPCEVMKSKFSCEDKTSNMSVKEIFKLLQTKSVVQVRTTSKVLTFKSADVGKFRQTFACLTP
jgi:hypothetical protein